MPDMDLNVLLKFIKPYDGKRETLNSFILNCNNALELASETQKVILFKYILSQLQGRAESACSIKEFSNWDQLKDFLKTQFSERKHYSHLLTDLQESRQGPNENVTQYSLKVETCLSQLLTEISLSITKQKELSGRTAAMEDLALHHFLMGLHPRLSNIIRSRAPKTLNEAINLAVSEERIQLSLYKKTNSMEPKSNNGNNSGKRFPPSKPNNFQQPQSYNNTQNPTGLFCKYCKNPGHDIKDCKKREYYNSRNRDQQQFRGYSGQVFPRSSPRRVNYVNNHVQEVQNVQEEEEETSYDTVDYLNE